MKTGIDLITSERHRQITVEGWTREHDSAHTNSELAEAALGYAEAAATQVRGRCGWATQPSNWPWNSEWWKPSDDPVRNLAKAGALIASEIDRLQSQKSIFSEKPNLEHAAKLMADYEMRADGVDYSDWLDNYEETFGLITERSSILRKEKLEKQIY